MQIRLVAVLVCALVFACGPVPGGSLAGRVAEVPADWSLVVPDGKTFCEIEARPKDPHSIQLECFLHEGSLYAQSHRWALAPWWPVQSWAAVWLEHPDVRVRIDDVLYEVTATPVTDAQERNPLLALRGYDPVPDGIVLFRFEPRPPPDRTSQKAEPGITGTERSLRKPAPKGPARLRTSG